MHVNSIDPANIPASAAITRQAQAVGEMQLALLKQIAASQEQLAWILQAAGSGRNIDTQA